MRHAFLVCLVVLTAAAHAQAQSSCDAPQVLIVLDRSSTMGERAPLADGTLKWDAAVAAITEITATYEESVYFGLMMFPSAGECTPGVVDVPVGPLRAAVIADTLGDPPPYSGYYTPMAASLLAAAEYEPLLDPTRRSFVVLITDGWEWCDPYDPETRFLPVDATEALTAAGITTYVVGFADGVDVLCLNRMAVTAGTDVAGCDPTSDDPVRADNCYQQVDNAADLRAALELIGRSVTAEVCDGLDNDCDGETDEGLSQSCATECGRGTEICVEGEWVDCDAPLPEEEGCDGFDNDCDGETDEGCACTDGETMPCGETEGECAPGAQACDGGLWGPCEGEVGAEDEVCDGLDNDCDSKIDEDVDCGAGMQCVAGECIDTSEPPPEDPPPDPEPETPVDPEPADPGGGGDGTGTTGCSCRAAGPAPDAAPRVLAELAALLF